MKVKMKVSLSGPRHDGTEWPRYGSEIDVPDWEGADLCAGGLATPVKEKVEEQAVPKADAETAAPKRRGPRKHAEIVPDEAKSED